MYLTQNVIDGYKGKEVMNNYLKIMLKNSVKCKLTYTHYRRYKKFTVKKVSKM